MRLFRVDAPDSAANKCVKSERYRNIRQRCLITAPFGHKGSARSTAGMVQKIITIRLSKKLLPRPLAEQDSQTFPNIGPSNNIDYELI